MRRILTILLLLVAGSMEAQTTYTSLFDTVVVNSSFTLIVKRPRVQATGIKYPVFWYQGGNGEIDNVSAATNTGPFRIMTGQSGISTSQQNAYAITDSCWIVQIIPFTNGCGCNPAILPSFPNNLYAMMDKFDLTYGFTHQDTTNYGFGGISQGGTNTYDWPTWPASLIGFGDPSNYRANRYKMFVESSMCNPRSGSQPNLLAGKVIRLFHAATDGTCSPVNSDNAFTSLQPYVTNLKETKFSGSFGHDNNTWDSAFSGRGIDSAHNMWLLFYKKAGGVAPTYTQAKIYDIYDALWGGYDGNNPWKWFDNQKGGHSNVDPKNGVTTDTTSTNNPAHGFLTSKGGPKNDLDIYGFVKYNRGIKYWFVDGKSRCWATFDLTGMKDPMDTLHLFNGTELWVRDQADTVTKLYVYNYHKQVLSLPVDSRWLPDARTDSVLNPIDSITLDGSGTWIHKTFADTVRMRYLRMMLTSTPTHHISNPYEIVIYGKYNYDTAALASSIRKPYSGYIGNHKDSTGAFKNKIGENTGQVPGPATMAHEGHMRVPSGVSYYDGSASSGIPPTLTYWPAGSSDFTDAKITTFKNQGTYPWTFVNGGNPYVGGLMDIDAPDVDPESPFVWTRDSALFSDLTKVYGRNSAGTNRFTGSIPNGKNLFNYIEPENEPIGNGYTHNSIFWKSRADYRAIHAADSTMKIVEPGLVDMADIQTPKTIWWKTQTLTTDHIFPYHIVNGHKYFDESDSLGGNIRSLSEQIGSHGQPPEWAINSNTYLEKYADSVIRAIWTYLPGMPVWLSETGHDAFAHAPLSDVEAGHTTQYSTPSISGLGDSTQVKAIWDARENIAIWASGFERGTQFEISKRDTNAIYARDQFYSMGKGRKRFTSDPFELEYLFPAYYYTGCVFDRLANYYFDTLLINGGRSGLWFRKGRSYKNSNDVVYIPNFGSKSNQSSTQSLPMAGLTSVKEVKPNFTNVLGDSATLTVTGGVLSRTVTEGIAMYFGTEGAVSPPSCTTNIGASSITQTTATLSWNSAATATGYQVWIDGSLITSVGGTSYNAFGFTAGTTHSFYVVPTNSGGSATGCSASASGFTMAAASSPTMLLKVYRF